MSLNRTRCYRCVGDIKNMIKYEKTKSANQRYICQLCSKTRVENYTYRAYKTDMNKNIIQFTEKSKDSGNKLQMVSDSANDMYTLANI